MDLLLAAGSPPRTSSGAIKDLQRKHFLQKRIAEISQYEMNENRREELAGLEKELSEYET